MALTLLEAAKNYRGDTVRSAVIELFAEQTDLLRMLPFENIQGNAYKYSQEEALPGIAFRGVNEAYSESTGVINPATEALVIGGGDIDVDTFIVRTMGEDRRTGQEVLKIKALAQKVANTIIKGDSLSASKEFDGLQVRLTGNQMVDAGATSGGDALSLLKLDEVIDAVDGANALIMSKAMKRLLNVANRTSTLSGILMMDKDEFGRPIQRYAGLPILVADSNDNSYDTLAFDEANPGGGSSVGTSIYAVRFGDGYLTGIQNGDMRVTDLGEQDAKPVLRTRVEWYLGMVLEHPRAAARLRGIKNAAVVA